MIYPEMICPKCNREIFLGETVIKLYRGTYHSLCGAEQIKIKDFKVGDLVQPYYLYGNGRHLFNALYIITSIKNDYLGREIGQSNNLSDHIFTTVVETRETDGLYRIGNNGWDYPDSLVLVERKKLSPKPPLSPDGRIRSLIETL